ncbi:MAG: hypothetical protein EXS31_14595 [Pedosphaera sp.]|nr:hypothetical protein [Pedosphaera sp.]
MNHLRVVKQDEYIFSSRPAALHFCDRGSTVPAQMMMPIPSALQNPRDASQKKHELKEVRDSKAIDSNMPVSRRMMRETPATHGRAQTARMRHSISQ